ncbi:MAG: hypothetical protein WDW38_001466 [Sanguina aurantia]
MAAAAAPVLVNLNTELGYGILTIQKEPVNSLDLTMWTALQTALDSLEANPAIHGVIIQSGLTKNVFSAGNDLLELYAPATTKARYSEFWTVSNAFLVNLYRSRLATVAAIKGASPAGGCIIAMCCEHRLMTPTGVIGLNEVALGIPVPKFWSHLMSDIIGVRAAESILLTGQMYSPPEALKAGLVDQLVEGPQLLPASERLMSHLMSLPQLARSNTKRNLRSEFAAKWEAYYATEATDGWAMLILPATLKTLAGALQRLGKTVPPSAKL